ncbi:MAG: hypothetical protein WC441_05265 [Patescibacteria group bacterium]
MKFVFVFAILMAACSEDGFIQLDPDSGTDSDNDSDSDAGTDAGYIDTDCSDVDQICDTPPADHCSADQTTVIEYSGDATCTDGVCNYSSSVEVCDYKCVEISSEMEPAYCIPEQCEGIICDHSNPEYEFHGDPEDTDDLEFNESINYDYCGSETDLLLRENIGHCSVSEEDNIKCGYWFLGSITCPNSCVVVEDGDDYCI